MYSGGVEVKMCVEGLSQNSSNNTGTFVSGNDLVPRILLTKKPKNLKGRVSIEKKGGGINR